MKPLETFQNIDTTYVTMSLCTVTGFTCKRAWKFKLLK